MSQEGDQGEKGTVGIPMSICSDRGFSFEIG